MMLKKFNLGVHAHPETPAFYLEEEGLNARSLFILHIITVMILVY